MPPMDGVPGSCSDVNYNHPNPLIDLTKMLDEGKSRSCCRVVVESAEQAVKDANITKKRILEAHGEKDQSPDHAGSLPMPAVCDHTFHKHLLWHCAIAKSIASVILRR
jgi:hypothetical protein